MSSLPIVAIAVCILLLAQTVVGSGSSLAVYDDCRGVGPLPMWSRGFSRFCCIVHPNKFGKHKGGFFEAGDKTDEHYFFKHAIISGDVVYVATPDLAAFVEYFLRLPRTTRIVLVTGAEDIGTPWEIFHPNRTNFFDYKMSALWPTGQPVSMRDFIRDPRLVKWFVQNYDLVGCNHFTCSDVDPSKDEDRALIAKVEPIPIGVDLHTLSEKIRNIPPEQVPGLVCNQRKQLSDALGVSPIPFIKRPLVVHGEFDCRFTSPKGQEIRKKTRGEVCRLLEAHLGDSRFTHHASNHSSISASAGKVAFWTKVTQCAFALAPPGFGMDTHRVWEILLMRTVPIVITSPLDKLYSQFPIVIVQRWIDVFAPGALEMFKKNITSRFGEEPFTSRVVHMSTIEYWVDRVNSAAAAAA